MTIDIGKYREARNPLKPFNLFPEDVLYQMMDGFCFYLHAAIVILRPKDKLDTYLENEMLSGERNNFTRLEPDEVRQTFNDFCSAYRRNHEDLCQKCDAKKATEYVNNPNKSAEIYECHMGLYDMAYPLKLRGQTVGVILAGQMMTEDCVSRVKNNVQETDAIEYQNLLFDRLDNKEICPRETDEKVRTTFSQFCKFGRMLQDLLDRLCSQQWESAKREFLGEVTRELTLAPIGTLNDWLKILNSILHDFLSISNLNGIKVYNRRQSRFELWGEVPPVDFPQDSDRQMLAKYVAPLPYGQLIPKEQLTNALKQMEDFKYFENILGFKDQNVTLFLHRHRIEPAEYLSTLVALSGQMENNDAEFVKDFCETIAMRVEITRLVFTLQEERIKFKDRVDRVHHTTKTPLQNALGALDDIKFFPTGIIKSEDIAPLVNLCIRNIRIAKLYMQYFYTSPVVRGKNILFRELLDSAMEAVRKISEDRQCIIKTEIESIFNPMVRDQGDLFTALINLLDNATKYSNPGGVVLVRLNSLDPGVAVVEVENNGQGIPKSHIEIVRTGRVRWSPPNQPITLQKRRQGTGLGLAMAVEYVESHGGWLEIRSRPEAPEYRRDPSDHWTTTVTIGFPIVDK
jgi:signal transduction histidine kinase/ligand-binding sensor protein